MSFLLPALVLLAAGTAVLLAVRVLGSRAGGSRRGRAAPGAPGSPPAEEEKEKEEEEEEEESDSRGPAAPGSGPYLPCGCGPGCGPCAAAARELRDLVTPLWPRPCFPRDPEVWQQWWRDLERLLERGRLPCCASSSSSGSPRHSRNRHPAGPPMGWKTSAARKGSVLRRTRRWLRSSTLPRMSIPRRGSSVAIQSLCDPCCAPTGTRPVPGKKQVEVSWSRRCPIHGSRDPAVEPSRQTLRTLLDERLQRERQLLPCPECSLELAVKDEAQEDLHTWDIYSEDLHPCQSLHEICWTPDGGAPTDRSPCCLGAVAFHRTHQIPTARKSPEIRRGAQAIAAKQCQQQEVSPSRRCPTHGSRDTAAVPQEKTLRAVLDKRLRRERERPLFKGALGRWLSRLGMQLVGSSWHTP